MRKVILALIFLLCTMISALVVVHSYGYISRFLPAGIAIFLSLVIETAFISYSVIGALSGRWNWIDKTLKAALFLLSVVPASLETSSEVRNLIFTRIAQQAPAPLVDNTRFKTLLQEQLVSLDQEIGALRQFKTTYSTEQQARGWYAFQDQKRIDGLLDQRKQVVTSVAEAEKSDAENQQQYQQRLQEFEEQQSLFGNEQWFDFAFLSWALLMLLIRQLINGRLSRNAAILLSQNNTAEANQSVPNLPTLNPDLDFKDLIHTFRPATVSAAELDNFLGLHSILDEASLQSFLASNYQSQIKKAVPAKQQKAVIEMFDQTLEYLGLEAANANLATTPAEMQNSPAQPSQNPTGATNKTIVKPANQPNGTTTGKNT